jgi:hypothetical protein
MRAPFSWHANQFRNLKRALSWYTFPLVDGGFVYLEDFGDPHRHAAHSPDLGNGRIDFLLRHHAASLGRNDKPDFPLVQSADLKAVDSRERCGDAVMTASSAERRDGALVLCPLTG